MSMRLFAVTQPGLEPFTRQELIGLGLKLPETAAENAAGARGGEESGGVAFEASMTDLLRANLQLRSANRILLRLGDFYAGTFSELRSRAGKLPWEQYIKPGQTVALRVTCHKSKLYHSGGVAERVAGGIQDRLGKEIQVVKFDEDLNPVPQLVVVRLFLDQCEISLDTSGALLHRREYRLEMAKAPLRETLAAALLLASGWDGQAALLDPFCGSGTIPIEAALMAGRIAPGKKRNFALMGWPGYDSKLWSALLKEAVAAERPVSTIIRGSDRDAGAVRIAQSNAERAGVLERIEFSCRAFSAVDPLPEPGWMVTNPPYGVRVSAAKDLRSLYAQLGNVLRAGFSGWELGMLCSDRVLAGQTQLPFEEPLRLLNGGIPVGFYRTRVP